MAATVLGVLMAGLWKPLVRSCIVLWFVLYSVYCTANDAEVSKQLAVERQLQELWPKERTLVVDQVRYRAKIGVYVLDPEDRSISFSDLSAPMSVGIALDRSGTITAIKVFEFE